MSLATQLELGSIWKQKSKTSKLPLIVKIVTGLFIPVYFPGRYITSSEGNRVFIPKGELRCLKCCNQFSRRVDGGYEMIDWKYIGYEYLICSDPKFISKWSRGPAHTFTFFFERIA